MRLIFIIVLVFLVSLCFAQKPRLPINVLDSSYALIAGSLRPYWDTATHQNHWHFEATIEPSDVGKIHLVDSVLATHNSVTIYFDTTFLKAVTLAIVPDETASRISQTTAYFQGQAGAQIFGNGGYMGGASVPLDHAVITFSDIKSLGMRVYYNSGWVIEDAPDRALNLSTSVPPTLAYSSGRLRVSALPFNMKNFPVVTGFNINGIDSLVGYTPSVDYGSTTQLDIYWWDSKNSHKLTAATPPPFLGAYIFFGETYAPCDPLTEDMGFNSNFMIIGVMKKN